VERITLADMIRNELERLGADGLCNNDIGCGCGIDDLAPCDGPQLNCQPAHAAILTKPREYCDAGDVWYVPLAARVREEGYSV